MSVSCTQCGRPDGTRRSLCPACYEHERAKFGWASRRVDAQPTRDHVNTLLSVGLSIRRISVLSGVNRKLLQTLLHGRTDRGTPPPHYLWDTTAQRLLAVPIPDLLFTQAADHALVPSYGTNRRLRALVAIGYTQDYLAQRLGLSPGNATHLFLGPPRTPRGKRPRITALIARKVATLYEELQETDGPSDAARRRAQRLGWLPPIAWDEDTIDLPHAWLDRQAARYFGTAPPQSFTSTYVELRELGCTNAEIASKLGYTTEELAFKVHNNTRLYRADERKRA